MEAFCNHDKKQTINNIRQCNKKTSFSTKDNKKIEAIKQLAEYHENIAALTNVITQQCAGLADNKTTGRAKKKAKREVDNVAESIHQILKKGKKASKQLHPIGCLSYVLNREAAGRR